MNYKYSMLLLLLSLNTICAENDTPQEESPTISEKIRDAFFEECINDPNLKKTGGHCFFIDFNQEKERNVIKTDIYIRKDEVNNPDENTLALEKETLKYAILKRIQEKGLREKIANEPVEMDNATSCKLIYYNNFLIHDNNSRVLVRIEGSSEKSSQGAIRCTTNLDKVKTNQTQQSPDKITYDTTIGYFSERLIEAIITKCKDCSDVCIEEHGNLVVISTTFYINKDEFEKVDKQKIINKIINYLSNTPPPSLKSEIIKEIQKQQKPNSIARIDANSKSLDPIYYKENRGWIEIKTYLPKEAFEELQKKLQQQQAKTA